MNTVDAVTACIPIGAAPVRGLGRGDEVLFEIMTTLHLSDDRLSSGGMRY